MRPNAFWLYCGSADRLAEIEVAAANAGVGKSKFLMMAYEAYILAQNMPQNQAASQEDLLQAKSRIIDLEAELASKDREIQRMKDLAHLEPSGEAEFNPALIAYLQTGPIHAVKILEDLGVMANDYEGIQAIANQLEQLERLGFAAKGPRGWRWQK